MFGVHLRIKKLKLQLECTGKTKLGHCLNYFSNLMTNFHFIRFQNFTNFVNEINTFNLIIIHYNNLIIIH